MLSRSQATTMYVIATPTACSFIHTHPTRTRERRVPSRLTPSPNRPQSLAALALALFSSCSSAAAASCARLLAPSTPAGDAGRRPPPPPLGQGVGSAGPRRRRRRLRALQVGASYEGCGKIFIDAGALRKHAHVHGERQHICHYENCGKKFMDSSKLKRHFLIHTGEKNFVCHYEGCGKAFSLDFNLKAHMKTHSADNYHVCPFPECGRRFTQESKLRAHYRAQHEKNPGAPTVNHIAPEHHHHKPVKPPAPPPAPSADRPYVCPYDGCDKAYIHEYKLNLHLRKEHPNHDQDAGAGSSKGAMSKSSRRRSRASHTAKNTPPAKIPKHGGGYAAPSPAVNVTEEHHWPRKVLYEDDSEETEEEGTMARMDEETEDEE